MSGPKTFSDFSTSIAPSNGRPSFFIRIKSASWLLFAKGVLFQQARHEMDRVRKDVERAVRQGKISVSESRQFLRFYESGLEGYTYLEEPSA